MGKKICMNVNLFCKLQHIMIYGKLEVVNIIVSMGFYCQTFFAVTGLNIVFAFLKLSLQLAQIAAAERIRRVGELRKCENNLSSYFDERKWLFLNLLLVKMMQQYRNCHYLFLNASNSALVD